MGAENKFDVRSFTVASAQAREIPATLQIAVSSLICGAACALPAVFAYATYEKYVGPILLLCFIVVAVACLFWKGHRSLTFGIVLGAFFGLGTGVQLAQSRIEIVEARAHGFASVAEHQHAKREGMTTAHELAELNRAKAEELAELRKRQQEIAKRVAEEDKRFAEQQAQENAERLARAEAECRRSASCTGSKYYFEASLVCSKLIQRSAKYAYKWTTGWFGMTFREMAWKNMADGIVRYSGDAVELKNGLGLWVPHAYECDFDTSSKRVVDLRLEPGRL